MQIKIPLNRTNLNNDNSRWQDKAGVFWRAARGRMAEGLVMIAIVIFAILLVSLITGPSSLDAAAAILGIGIISSLITLSFLRISALWNTSYKVNAIYAPALIGAIMKEQSQYEISQQEAARLLNYQDELLSLDAFMSKLRNNELGGLPNIQKFGTVNKEIGNKIYTIELYWGQHSGFFILEDSKTFKPNVLLSAIES